MRNVWLSRVLLALPVIYLVRRRQHTVACSLCCAVMTYTRMYVCTHQIQALSKATSELGVRTEMSEKWELKTGEMQQKIIELEK
jgi:hypothetical protein